MPEPQKEVGAYKKLGSVEMFTKRMFVDGDLRIFETIQGDFVLSNGEFIKDKNLFNILPPPHQQNAFAWWDRTFGADGQPTVTGEGQEGTPLTCEVCGKVCKNELGLSSHMKSHKEG
jgi:hypothetical protein